MYMFDKRQFGYFSDCLDWLATARERTSSCTSLSKGFFDTSQLYTCFQALSTYGLLYKRSTRLAKLQSVQLNSTWYARPICIHLWVTLHVCPNVLYVSLWFYTCSDTFSIDHVSANDRLNDDTDWLVQIGSWWIRSYRSCRIPIPSCSISGRPLGTNHLLGTVTPPYECVECETCCLARRSSAWWEPSHCATCLQRDVIFKLLSSV